MLYIIAHRGLDNHCYHENTIEAFLACLSKDYLSGIEFDIRLTKDHQLIVYHNPVIILKGIHIIANMTYRKILRITASEDYMIPTLNDVLAKIRSSKQLIIDIKDEGNRFAIIIKKLLHILKKYPHLNILLCSFNVKILKSLEVINSGYKTGLIVSRWINYKQLKRRFGFLVLESSLYDRVQFTRPIYFWTINQKELYEKIALKKSSYAIGIITDKAYLFKKNI